jgi:hypothetical protein
MSTIKANTLLHSDGSTTTQPSIPALDKRMAKAWVNFNGTSTVAIRSSYNVSSITDSGTGDYTANFAVAMANTNYAASSNVEPTVSNGGSDTYISSLATASCRLNHFEVGTRRDGNPCNVIVMGGS